MRCFILNERHEPVEVGLTEQCIWDSEHGTIRRTEVGVNGRVRTAFSGVVNDNEEPHFTHFVSGPGMLLKTADTPTYDEAVARHDRIVEWLRKRIASNPNWAGLLDGSKR